MCACLKLRELPKLLGFAYNIFATAGASVFTFGMQLGFGKAHNKIICRRKGRYGPGLGDLPEIWGFPFDISATAEPSDFTFGIRLGFANAPS